MSDKLHGQQQRGSQRCAPTCTRPPAARPPSSAAQNQRLGLCLPQDISGLSEHHAQAGQRPSIDTITNPGYLGLRRLPQQLPRLSPCRRCRQQPRCSSPPACARPVAALFLACLADRHLAARRLGQDSRAQRLK